MNPDFRQVTVFSCQKLTFPLQIEPFRKERLTTGAAKLTGMILPLRELPKRVPYVPIR